MLNSADADFLATLAAELPEGTLRPVEERYLEEPRGWYHGQAAAVACPATVDEVATILRIAHAARVGVVPYGGGTGLVGGQVLTNGPLPLIVSLERMTRIRALDAAGGVIVVEAGAILADVHAAASDAGRMFPLTLGSQGSARIGGLLGTNAGGTGVLRWGNMRDLCLGLEVVLADGRVWNGLKRLRKNNMGYDLRHLMIGSEGTLGIITAASLRLVAPPARSGVALMVVNSPADAVNLLAMAQRRLAEAISAFELISGMGLRFLAQTMPEVRQPYADPPEWLVLIDVGLSGDPDAALESLFEEAVEAGLVVDGLIAQSEAQRAQFWHMRESIPHANRGIGPISSHDISVPIADIPVFLERAEAEIARFGGLRINAFGHMGDGNLHYNIYPPEGQRRRDFIHLRPEVAHCVYEVVASLQGSASAEHGIGRLKVADLERYGDPVGLEVMHGIKALLDPHGILNPGAVLNPRPVAAE